MADKWNSDPDEPVVGGSDEEIRGVAAEDDEFEDAGDPDEDDEAEEEEGSTF